MTRILVADDQPHVLRVLTLTLERAGYAVETAADGAAAFERLQRAPQVDALVTDIGMPAMSGRELCARIAATLPERRFPILVMSGMTERDEREWVRAMDGIHFVEKPVSPRALLATLRQVLASGTAEAVGG